MEVVCLLFPVDKSYVFNLLGLGIPSLIIPPLRPPPLRPYLLFRQPRVSPGAIWSPGEYPLRLRARSSKAPRLVPPAQGLRVGVFRGRQARRSVRGKWSGLFCFQCQSVSGPTFPWHGQCMAWPWRRLCSFECHTTQGKLLAPPERPPGPVRCPPIGPLPFRHARKRH